jgi:hypothetical protein
MCRSDGVIAENSIITRARFSGLGWLGSVPAKGTVSSITPASPLNRVFYCLKFCALTAKMRQQVRYPCFDLLASIARDISLLHRPLTGAKTVLATTRPTVGKSGPNGLFPDADSRMAVKHRRVVPIALW